MISSYLNIGGHTLECVPFGHFLSVWPPISLKNETCLNQELFKIKFWSQNFYFSKEVFFGKAAEEFNITCSIDRQQDRATFHLKTPLVVKDDVKFMFYSTEVIIHNLWIMSKRNSYFFKKSVPRNYEDCGFYFWLNTGFFPASGNLTLERHELDNPHKSKTWKTFTDGFSCTVHSQVLS